MSLIRPQFIGQIRSRPALRLALSFRDPFTLSKYVLSITFLRLHVHYVAVINLGHLSPHYSVSHIQKCLELSPMVPSAFWCVVFIVLGKFLQSILHVVSNFFCIPVFCPKMSVYLTPLQSTVFVLLIHLAVCLTTGPKPLPKRALHIVRPRASSFK